LEAALQVGEMKNGQLPNGAAVARRVRNGNARKRGRPRNSHKTSARVSSALPSVGTLARTKALLLAALRVWELKHRVSD